MDYMIFKNIFNSTIFESSKKDLLEKVAKYPNRYIGLFRPTKPKAKLLQNLLQSHEIRFGDAFEILIEEYLKEKGFGILEKVFCDRDGNALNVDQLFKKEEGIYFVEQKVRDDHDSTKKRGQTNNFEKKLNILIGKYGDENLHGYFYFIDPELIKNRNYYQTELQRMQEDYGVELFVCYGKELFKFLNIETVWDEILDYLKRWRNEIPELPEINFDLEAEHSFNEIKDLSPIIFRKLLSNDELFNQIVLTIFPEKRVLHMLSDYFGTKDKKIHRTLKNMIDEKIK